MENLRIPQPDESGYRAAGRQSQGCASESRSRVQPAGGPEREKRARGRNGPEQPGKTSTTAARESAVNVPSAVQGEERPMQSKPSHFSTLTSIRRPYKFQTESGKRKRTAHSKTGIRADELPPATWTPWRPEPKPSSRSQLAPTQQPWNAGTQGLQTSSSSGMLEGVWPSGPRNKARARHRTLQEAHASRRPPPDPLLAVTPASPGSASRWVSLWSGHITWHGNLRNVTLGGPGLVR